MTLQIVAKRDPHAFEVLPRRWVVERTFAWISKHRRTVRDYEHLPASHEAMILWAMVALMTRRLAQPAQLSDAHLDNRSSACPPERRDLSTVRGRDIFRLCRRARLAAGGQPERLLLRR